MKLPIFIVFAGIAFSGIVYAQNDAPQNSCVSCHEMMGAPYDSLVHAQQADIHGKNGITCTDCHGGNSTSMDYEVAMSPAAGFRGKPKPKDIPELCGKCHANPDYMKQYDPGLRVDQLTEYHTSQHGQLLKKGDTKVAQCVSCHGAHGIYPANVPLSSVYPVNVPETCGKCHADEKYMADYNIPTDQYAQYKTSVHGRDLLEKKDLGAPACNDCHGNHGATPPGLTSIARVCGTCHVNNQKLFQKSVHKKIFDMMDMPECITCHGNHGIQVPSDSMIGTTEKSICMECHGQGDAGYIVAQTMSNAIDSLKQIYHHSEDLIQQASEKDMDVSDLKFELRDVRQNLIQTRTMIHSFDTTQVLDIQQKGMKVGTDLVASAKDLISEYYFRRKGLVVFTLVITILAVLLYIKIRQLD